MNTIFKIFGVLIFVLSCKNENQIEKEKYLLNKEIELLKKENELIKVEDSIKNNKQLEVNIPKKSNSKKNTPIKNEDKKLNYSKLKKSEKINFVLNEKIGSSWRLEKIGDFINDPYEIEIINSVKKIDNNFPFYAFGDFDGDKNEDIAMKIVKNGISKLIIYNPNKDKIYWWKEDVENAVIKKVKPNEIESYNGERAFKMKTDGIMVEYMETSLYYIFWNGDDFSQIWLSD